MLIESPVAANAWRAELALQFARRGEHTRLTQRTHTGPLRVQKALYPEGGAVCHAILLHPPAGIAGGDELQIDVAVEPAAHALLTTPGAGKWYRSAAPWARQTINLYLENDARLEWLPQETIFFSGCRAALQHRVTLGAGARYLGWDVWCMGRSASGERFERGEFQTATEIRLADDLIWVEQGKLSGGSTILHSPAGLAGRSVCGTLLAAGATTSSELLAACRALVPGEAHALHGITALPSLLVARYLGHSSEAARAWFVGLWCLLRPALLGREAQPPRIWST